MKRSTDASELRRKPHATRPPARSVEGLRLMQQKSRTDSTYTRCAGTLQARPYRIIFDTVALVQAGVSVASSASAYTFRSQRSIMKVNVRLAHNCCLVDRVPRLVRKINMSVGRNRNVWIPKQFRLQTMLLTILALCLLMAGISWKLGSYRNQRAIVASLDSAHAS